MSGLNYSLILILILQCIVVASILIVLYRSRNYFGLSLIYISLGLFRALHFFINKLFSFEIISGINISIGATVLFPAILFTILFIYIREDANEARKIIYALIGANIVFVIIQLVLKWGFVYSGFDNHFKLQIPLLHINWRIVLSGTFLIFIDSFIIIYFYETFSRLVKNLFSRLFLTMGLVFILHAFIFALGAFAGTRKFQIVLLSGLVAKIIPLFVFSFIFWFYLKFVETKLIPELQFENKLTDVFSFLTFRKHYEKLIYQSELKLKQKINELTRLNSIFKNINFSITIDKLVKTVIEEISKNLKPDVVLFYRRNNSNLELLGVGPESADNNFDKSIPHKVGVCLCGLAAKMKLPQYSVNITKDIRCTLNECKDAGIHSFASVPLIHENEVLGVLGIASKTERDFSLSSSFLETISSQVSIAFANSILHSDLQNRQDKLLIETEKRKKIYADLLEEEQRYANLFNNSPISIWEEDFADCVNYLNGLISSSGKSVEKILEDNNVVIKCSSLVKILDVNDVTLSLYKAKSKDELLSNLTQIFAPESLKIFKLGLIAIFNGAKSFEAEAKNKTITGEEIDIYIKWNIAQSPNNLSSKIIVSLIDITGRKKIEIETKKIQETLIQTLENMNDGFVSLDRNWCYTYMNKTAGTIFNRDPKEMIGKHIWTEFPEDVGQPFQLNYEKSMNERKFIKMEEHFPPYDKWFENRIVPTPEGISIFFTDITERKRHTKKLIQLSEERKELESIVNKSQAVAFLWRADENWTVEYVSENISQFGYSKEELLSGELHFSKILYSKDVERVAQEVKHYLESNIDEFVQEYRIVTKTNEVKWVEDRTWVRRDSENIITHYQGIILDITEKKEAQNELIVNENRFRNIVEHSHDGIEIIDDNYKLIYANDELVKIFGYPHDEIIDAKIEKFLTDESKDFVLDRYKRRQNGENVANSYEITIKQKNEDIRDIKISASIIKTSENKINTIAQLLDITNEKLARKKLIESENKLRTVLEQAGDAMYLFDFDGNIIDVNRKACESLGYQKEELLKLNIEKISLFFKETNEKKRTWEKLKPDETRTIYRTHVRKNGTTFPVEITTGLIEIKEQKLVLGFARDITEKEKTKKKLQQYRDTLEETVKMRTEQLVRANQELESFSYSVSHDLRAPLRHINSFIELLTSRLGSNLDNKSLHYFNTIAHASDQMGILIDELLDFSRMGRKNMIATDIDFNNLVLSVKEDFDKITDSNNQIINWEIDKLPISKGDVSMLKVVFTNLISNAIKYSSKKEETNIHIGYEEVGNENIFYVEDNGAGFDMRFVDKLFGVFQRLHSKKEFEGTGIGLANVRRIINRHGGRTWAESKLGKGAKFYFSLPKDFKISKG